MRGCGRRCLLRGGLCPSDRSEMIPARIIVLSDGRPGHFRLSEGLVAAIARLRPVEVDTVVTRRPRWLGGPLALATNAQASADLVLRRVFGIDGRALLPADVIVSAGAETLAANIALARLGAVPNIFYGSLRRFRASDFTLALTSYRRASMPANQLVTLKPAAFDPDAMRAANALDGARTIALILGGSAPRCTWAERDWQSLYQLVDAGRANDRRWLIANSRRTPDAASDRFRDIATQHPGQISFLDVRQPAAASLAGVLAEAGSVVVTADSSSMISEAIWARRPVVAVMPHGGTFTSDEGAYRTWLAEQGWAATIGSATLTLDTLDRITAQLIPRADNPQAALADLIAKHMPNLFGMAPAPVRIDGSS